MTFAERLKDRARPILAAQLDHPFVQGLADGTLSLDRFRYYMIQDTLYIVAYARTIAWAAALVPEAEQAMRMLDSARETFEIETALKETYFAEFGVTMEEVLGTEPAPTCTAYMDHLHRYTRVGVLAEAMAAIIPCGYIYVEIGRELTGGRDLAQEHPYRSWLMTYALPELRETVDWWFEVLDRAAAGKPEAELAPIESIFLRSCRYEWMFWDMAWNLETWRP
ncbi:MAG: thiaminase II [Proteobacteria bacterium]|nr:thiaminase II [Pseudomonadota bacterium]